MNRLTCKPVIFAVVRPTKPSDQPCPVAACAPCETTETSDSKSSAITLTRTLLVGGIIVVALILGLSGRNKRLQEDESFEIDLDDQEN